MRGTVAVSPVSVLTMRTSAGPTGRPSGTRSDRRRMPRRASTTVLDDAGAVTAVPEAGVNVTLLFAAVASKPVPVTDHTANGVTPVVSTLTTCPAHRRGLALTSAITHTASQPARTTRRANPGGADDQPREHIILTITSIRRTNPSAGATNRPAQTMPPVTREDRPRRRTSGFQHDATDTPAYRLRRSTAQKQLTVGAVYAPFDSPRSLGVRGTRPGYGRRGCAPRGPWLRRPLAQRHPRPRRPERIDDAEGKQRRAHPSRRDERREEDEHAGAQEHRGDEQRPEAQRPQPRDSRCQ